MLSKSEKNILPYLLQRSVAGDCVDLVKMKTFVPSEVADKMTGYKTRIVEMLFDPLRHAEVNAKFRADGFEFDDRMHVIALTDDGEILLWSSWNSIYHLERGGRISNPLDEKHMAFQDIKDLTEQFALKRKKVDIDEMFALLRQSSFAMRF